MINAAKLKAEGKDITALLEGLEDPAESIETRFVLTSEDTTAAAGRILEDMEKWVRETAGLEIEVPNYEGVRVNYDLDGARGWFLLRKSLHDDVMPLNIESDTDGGSDKVLALVSDFLSRYDEIKAL